MDTEVIAAGDTFAPGRRVGAVLADARAARGVELADIARETRVPVRHLVAIEADAHDNLPALPYAIGFVKAFARAVGVDAETAGAQFRAETNKTAHVPAAAPMAPLDERRLPPRGLVAISVAALLAVVGGVVAWSAGAFDASNRPAPITVAAASPQTAPVTAQVGTSTAAASRSATLPSAGLLTPSAAVPAGAIVPGAVGVPSAIPPVASGPSAVVITANEDAWFRVSGWNAAANKVVAVKTGVLAKGERYAVPPTPGLKLWTGRAGALAITIDGRAVPSLGGPVETVRNISLDPVALRARITGSTMGNVTG